MFKVNDIIICVNDTPDVVWEGHRHLKEGKTYQIKGLVTCNCMTRLMLKGFAHTHSAACGYCRCGPIKGFRSNRFIKLAGDDVKTEEKEELPCSDSTNQKTVQKTGFMNVLKRLKEKISA